ncbi:MAG TPA: dockerin type I domain-containing protein [bacterium]|nr:dockerin type I domain-containing protein [bacterium]
MNTHFSSITVLVLALGVQSLAIGRSALGAPFHYTVLEDQQSPPATLAALHVQLEAMGLQLLRPLLGKLAGRGYLWNSPLELTIQQIASIQAIEGVHGAYDAYLGWLEWYNNRLIAAGSIGIFFEHGLRDAAAAQLVLLGFRRPQGPISDDEWWRYSPLEYSYPQASAAALVIQGIIRTYPSGVYELYSCLFDVNSDGTVGILDLIFIRARMGQDPLSGNNRAADINNDGKINILDLIFVRNQIGSHCP